MSIFLRQVAIVRTELRQDRLRRQLTWKQYAAWLGVAPSTLFNILQGTKRPSALTLARIAERIGCLSGGVSDR